MYEDTFYEGGEYTEYKNYFNEGDEYGNYSNEFDEYNEDKNYYNNNNNKNHGKYNYDINKYTSNSKYNYDENCNYSSEYNNEYKYNFYKYSNECIYGKDRGGKYICDSFGIDSCKENSNVNINNFIPMAKNQIIEVNNMNYVLNNFKKHIKVFLYFFIKFFYFKSKYNNFENNLEYILSILIRFNKIRNKNIVKFNKLKNYKYFNFYFYNIFYLKNNIKVNIYKNFSIKMNMCDNLTTSIYLKFINNYPIILNTIILFSNFNIKINNDINKYVGYLNIFKYYIKKNNKEFRIVNWSKKLFILKNKNFITLTNIVDNDKLDNYAHDGIAYFDDSFIDFYNIHEVSDFIDSNVLLDNFSLDNIKKNKIKLL